MTVHSYTLPDRAILHLSGPDTLDFLRGLVTQSLTKLTDDQPVYSLLLTPQGKIISDFFIAKKDDDLLLECPASVAETLKKKLTLYKLRATVEIEDVSHVWTAVQMWGEEERLEKVIAEAPAFLHAYRDPRLPALGVRVLGPTQAKPALPGEVSRAEWDGHRTALGVPEFDRDFVSEQTFPMDVNMDRLNAIDYKKGCFVGQEVASRMKRKGEVRKRTLIADATAPLAIGSPVMAGESTLGEITSTAGNQGLALVRLDRLDKAGDTGIFVDGQTVSLTLPPYLED
ncbi:YgfZ/GcvT domain-containing protein [Aquisalinus flavus]|uniref:Folate-binding protein n=1 Tax=Aquisalinus flavus TaxID=1526572 RepID=A0A8J2V231_9PROT|nr:folate-binding protein YgfZ [Aquisalinus flavus]MBD0426518.1 folate-binding protein YgfZ [Aquisalinus flavus]UNE47931.1 folate-binding protein YgfZ [Aquisalinus flavus]GGD07314.1 folate-binding protein [Aquisalinus flavus]